MAVGCGLQKERRTDVGRREGMEEELEGKWTLLIFLESRRVVRQPRLLRHF